MSSFYLHLPPIKRCFTGTLICCHTSTNPLLSAFPQSWRPQRSAMGISVVTMRDRSKNRKPTQRGRYLSIEGIQAVQALKKAKVNGGLDAVAHEIETKVRRLVKFDLVAVLRELQWQGEAILAFQVFEELRREHWYKPQVSIYVDIISVLAKSGLYEKVEQVCSYLKTECLEPDTEGFNLLMKTLLEYGFTQTAMDCFRLMKLWESEPDEHTFRILISGLESNGDKDSAIAIRAEAKKQLGRTLEFFEE
ncbi:pentatricopeptide repeat-containing protein At1g62350-like [Dendrobium catenatum]|uniref:Pentatricopeptide repeat-containing protein n=1 Tax=Dendrobium catenatum TaxID=906689 RepID=A0A2I0X0W7_9ASPA|nr:pentatricopeptide repeat-containing protein At1g62350-like [Dendrobium catenatum]PKU81549.1 Pentatricopeptide repeat-containing protein [Dendrobium catenatum]